MKKILFLLTFSFLLSPFFAGPVFAENEIIDEDCRIYLAKQIKLKEPDMEDFVSKHFLSSKLTSELIDAAIDRLSLYEDFLDSKLHKDWAKANFNSDLTSQATLLFECEAIVENNVEKWKQLIKEQSYATSKAKSNLALLEAYKRINEKLRELNNMVANLKIYFEGFSKNLPCITKKCITK